MTRYYKQGCLYLYTAVESLNKMRNEKRLSVLYTKLIKLSVIIYMLTLLWEMVSAYMHVVHYAIFPIIKLCLNRTKKTLLETELNGVQCVCVCFGNVPKINFQNPCSPSCHKSPYSHGSQLCCLRPLAFPSLSHKFQGQLWRQAAQRDTQTAGPRIQQLSKTGILDQIITSRECVEWVQCVKFITKNFS